ncbi:MAG: hypothetical protein ABFD92_07180 [Planctomycetaceae bacterium]|nr:hypothetical protein [Planctomycetaceae bacterium]
MLVETITFLPAAVVWQPVISPMHIFGAATVLAALAIVAYARSMSARPKVSAALLAMRLIVIAALAALLMGPSGSAASSPRQVKGQLHVLVDTSQSMLTGDCPGGVSRMKYLARNWLSPRRLAELGEHYNVTLMGFDESLHPLAAAPGGDGEGLAMGRSSRIADCVASAVGAVNADGGQSAVLVLSDGHDSDRAPMQPVALLAKARGVPVHSVCLGGATAACDLLLQAHAQQQFLLAGETAYIEATVHQSGLENTRTKLHMQCGKESVDREIVFDGKDRQTLRLGVRQEQGGLYEYTLRVDPVAGETETGNNAQTLFLEVTRQQIKVLLIEGEPSWDTKFIGQSLRKDARVALTQIIQLTGQKKQSIVSRAGAASVKLPATVEEFAAYDVIVLGRGLENILDRNAAAMLGRFVADHGGQIIFARSRAYETDTAAGRQMGRDLAVLEPVVWGSGMLHDLPLQLTPAGQAAPCFAFESATANVAQTVLELPGFSVMPAIAREKASTVVLARALLPGQARQTAAAQGMPALVYMHYGRGRVAAVLGEGLWRWGILPPELSRYDGLYDIFWSNMIRWLALDSDFLPGQDAALKFARSSLRLGDPMVVDVSCKQAPQGGFRPTVTWIAPDGVEQALALRQAGGLETRLQTTLTPAAAGIHRIVMDCPQIQPPRIERKFGVYDVNLERLRSSADPEALRTLSEQSGGAFFTPSQGDELVPQMIRLSAQRQIPQRAGYIWDKALVLVLLLLWAGAEWLARKRAGLL